MAPARAASRPAARPRSGSRRRSARRAPRPDPGSRSRRRARATRRLSRYQSSSSSLSSRNSTPVLATAVRAPPLSIRQIPPITACRRPDSARSVERAAPGRAACRRSARPPTTIVSTPSTGSPGRSLATAAALRRAFATATSSGGPSSSSSTSGHDDRELDPQQLEDRSPLGRARGQDQRHALGKNSATSRAADSGESEPWTMFWPTSIAKSPRIEPGAASIGLVAPIT